MSRPFGSRNLMTKQKQYSKICHIIKPVEVDNPVMPVTRRSLLEGKGELDEKDREGIAFVRAKSLAGADRSAIIWAAVLGGGI